MRTLITGGTVITAAIPSTRDSPTWSASCLLAVTGSASAGTPTTWVCTAPAASTFTTPSWGTCICPTKSWNYRDPGLSLVAYSAEEGSPDDDALRLLASWAATADQTGDLPTYA